MEFKLSPKENYIRYLSGEIPEYIPSMLDGHGGRVAEDLLTPQACPNGPIVTTLGVKYVGSADLNNGAMPAPGEYVVTDILKWRDQLKIPDFSDFDFEDYYAKKTKGVDLEHKYITFSNGDYFLTLVSLMGFEDAMLALYEEPEEVKAMLDYVADFYLLVQKMQTKYVHPDGLMLMDDDAAYRAPFFSVEMYHEFFKPYHKMHCDLALENGMFIERHDCGKCEQFIPDWIEMGITNWNPAQTTNDLVGIKAKYGRKLGIAGGWDNVKWGQVYDEDELRAGMEEYVETFAPGGGFSFSVMGAMGDDPKVKRRTQFIHDFYFDYVQPYYKNHGIS
jgi:hypothetical protein